MDNMEDIILDEDEFPFPAEYAAPNGGTGTVFVMDINARPVSNQVEDGSQTSQVGLENWEDNWEKFLRGSLRTGELKDPNLRQLVMLVLSETNTASSLNTPTQDSFPEGSETTPDLSNPSVDINTMPVLNQVEDGSRAFPLDMRKIEETVGAFLRTEKSNLSQAVMPSKHVALKPSTARDLNTPTHDLSPEGSKTTSDYLSSPTLLIDRPQLDCSIPSPSSSFPQISKDTGPLKDTSRVEKSFNNTSISVAVEGAENVQRTRDVKFVLIKSNKKMNTPYLVPDDPVGLGVDIMTHREKPVLFEVQGWGLEGLEFQVSVRNPDPIKSPVRSCERKKHLSDSPDSTRSPADSIFYLMMMNGTFLRYDYKVLDGHLTAIVSLRDAHTYKQEQDKIEFYIVFRCWNSCLGPNTNLNLVLTAVDPNTGKYVVEPQSFKLLVSTNLGRDLLAKKRKMGVLKEELTMPKKKVMKMEVPGAVNQTGLPPTSPAVAPTSNAIKADTGIQATPQIPQIIQTPTPMKKGYMIFPEVADHDYVLEFLRRTKIDACPIQLMAETPTPAIATTSWNS